MKFNYSKITDRFPRRKNKVRIFRKNKALHEELKLDRKLTDHDYSYQEFKRMIGQGDY